MLSRRMIRCILTLFLCLAAMLCVGCKADHPDVGTGGQALDFSFEPPEGWVERAVPGMTAKAYFAPEVDGFSSNVNFVFEELPMPLSDYVQGNIEQIAKMWPRAEFGETESFQTAGGVQGYKVVFLNPYMGEFALRQTVYFFSEGHNKLVMTWSTRTSVGASLAPTIDRSTSTLKFY